MECKLGKNRDTCDSKLCDECEHLDIPEWKQKPKKDKVEYPTSNWHEIKDVGVTLNLTLNEIKKIAKAFQYWDFERHLMDEEFEFLAKLGNQLEEQGYKLIKPLSSCEIRKLQDNRKAK